MDFTTLVTDGIIDQATADKMTAYMTEKNATRQAEMEKVKAMTETERQAYFESNKDTKRIDFFSTMVTDGVITQEQADAIQATMPAIDKNKEDFKHPDKDYSALVTDGVITQETADKMNAYMTEKNSERQAEMEKVKAMTADERKAYFEANKNGQKTDKMADMVTNGILTQEEADAIKATMPPRPERTINN